MVNPNGRGPRPLSEILGELFTRRGYGRLRALSELEDVWNSAVGEPHCHQTQIGEVRRGILNVTVAHPALLEELAAFRKPALLQALRANVSGKTIYDIKFRVGLIVEPEVPKITPLPSLSSGILPPRRSKAHPDMPARGRRASGRNHDRDRTVGEE